MSHLSAPLLISPHTDTPHDVKSLILMPLALNLHCANSLISVVSSRGCPCRNPRDQPSYDFRNKCPPLSPQHATQKRILNSGNGSTYLSTQFTPRSQFSKPGFVFLHVFGLSTFNHTNSILCIFFLTDSCIANTLLSD